MSSEKRLFLLDGYALIFRAYYAYIRNPLLNSKGMNVSAVYGYVNAVIDLLKRENPTHIALVMDCPVKTHRAEEFEFYKANRPPTPEDIKSSVPIIEEVTKAFKIPILKLPGFEADDIIGTLAKAAEKEGFTTFMVTPDKDFGQLVSENIFMYKPARQGKPREILGIPEIKEQWQIENVLQLIDILGLMGDASDNIPGIPGVGEKTAIKLLKAHGSIENLLENTASLKGKLKERVEENKDKAIISKKLATIILDVPVEYSFDDFVLEKFDDEELTRLFNELEFRTLGKRILGEDYTVNNANTEASKKAIGKAAKNSDGSQQLDLFGGVVNQINADLVKDEMKKGKTIENSEHIYHLVKTEKGRARLIKDLLKQKKVCFDTETTGLDANACELVGIAFSWKPTVAYYVPIPEDQKEAQKVINEFKELLESDKIIKIGQNIKYDMLVLKWYGINVSGPLSDTMVQHHLIYSDLRHNLDYLTETYLGYTMVSIETLIGKKGKNQGTMRDVPNDKIKEYAGEDADLTLQLHEKFEKSITEGGFDKLYKEVETPLLSVLTDIEYEGIKIDADFLNDYSDQLLKEIDGIKASIFEQAGEEFNMDSPKQLGPILFDKLKIPYKGKKTKTGQYSTGEETLSKLKDKHPVIEKIMEYRTANKLKSTYVDALPKLINARTGRLHSTFNPAIASTGRLSSSNPNLQNIPIRTEKGREVRKAFVPRNNDFTLMAADYSQIELRIIASMSKDKAMLEAFRSGIDIHSATAANVYKVDLEAVTGEQRRKAKMVNFGIIYGISAFGLAQRLKVKRDEAKELIEAYFEQYPDIKTFMTEAVGKARKLGYAETILGRRRYLKDIDSRNGTVRSFAERNAINAPIQGSAADMIKVAMIEVNNEMKKRELKSKMILQVHDELLFDAHKSEEEELRELVHNKMVNAIKMDVPIEVEIGVGENWLVAH